MCVRPLADSLPARSGWRGMVAAMTRLSKPLLLAALVGSAAALAQTCPQRSGLAGRSDAQRLRFLSSQLAAEAARGDTWTHAWGAGYAGLTVVQLAASPLIVESDKIEWYVGALSSAIGVAFVTIDPLEVIEAGPVFQRRAGWAHAPDEICALIAEGEGLMQRGAGAEQQSRRWYMHGANVALNLGLGLILGLGVGHWVAAAVNVVVGVALGELTIFTAPDRLISAWAEYQQGELGEASAPLSFKLVPMVRPDAAGLALAVRF